MVSNLWCGQSKHNRWRTIITPNLLEIVDELKKIANNLHLNTNGMPLTTKLVDVFRYRSIVLRIGIDAINSEQPKPNLNNVSSTK